MHKGWFATAAQKCVSGQRQATKVLVAEDLPKRGKTPDHEVGVGNGQI